MAIKVSGNFRNAKSKVNINLSLFAFKEKDIFIVYSPALDVSGYGKTEKEAYDSFTVSLDEFLDYTTKKGTLQKELRKLGWKVEKKKKKIVAPDLNKLLVDREFLTEIINEKDFHKFNTPISIPVNA